MRNFLVSLLALCAMSVAMAQAPSFSSAQQYASHDTLTPQGVLIGKVVTVREVAVSKQRSGFGTLLGAMAGAALGTQIGKGHGRQLAIGALTLTGGAAGSRAQRRGTQRVGYEIIVQRPSGEMFAVVQDADLLFDTGEVVFLIQGRAGWRIVPAGQEGGTLWDMARHSVETAQPYAQSPQQRTRNPGRALTYRAPTRDGGRAASVYGSPFGYRQ